MNTHTHSEEELKHIWHQVPPDYYQNGVKKNILQKMWHYGKLNNIINIIESKKKAPENILDVGCASGWFLYNLSKKFQKSLGFGVDIYEDAISYGKKKYKHLKFFHADGHKLPFKDNSFEVIVCNEVLEHVVDPLKVLKEIKRVLRKNGIAVIEMDTGNFLFKIVWFWWTNLRKGVWKDAHIQVFNTDVLEQVIKKSGFKIVKKKIFNASMAVVFLLEK